MKIQENISVLSTLFLVILAIFGYGIQGIRLFDIHIFPFIIYLVLIHIPLIIITLVHQKSRISLSTMDILLILLLVYSLLTVTWASNKQLAVASAGLVVASIIVGLLISLTTRTQRKVQIFTDGLMVLTIAIISLGLMGYLTYLGVQFDIFQGAGFHTSGWYSNRNDFSYLISMVTPLFITTFIGKRGIIGTFYFATFLFLETIIILNGSRGVILGQIVMLATIGSLISLTKVRESASGEFFNRLQSIKRPFTILAVVSIPILACVFLFVPNPFTNLPQNSIMNRWYLHRGGFILLLDSPLGVGLGNFPIEYATLGLPPGEIGPHSWFVRILSEFGIIGTVAFLWTYTILLDSLFTEYLRNHSMLSLGLFGSLVNFAISGLSPANALNLQIQWIIIGIAIAYIKTSTGSGGG